MVMDIKLRILRPKPFCLMLETKTKCYVQCNVNIQRVHSATNAIVTTDQAIVLSYCYHNLHFGSLGFWRPALPNWESRTPETQRQPHKKR